jgi:hypothetical protein
VDSATRKKINSVLQVVFRELSYLFVIIAALYSIRNPPRSVGVLFIDPDIRVIATTSWISMAILGSLLVMVGYYLKLHSLEKIGISLVVSVAATLAAMGIYFDNSTTNTLLSILLLAFSFSQINRYFEVSDEERRADFVSEIIKQSWKDEP